MEINKEYNIKGEKITMDYSFLIKDEKTYKGVKNLLTRIKGLNKLNDREDLQFYSLNDGNFIVFDDRGFDGNLAMTKNINGEIKKGLAEILGVEIK
ncbi:hypothetical protein KAJ87_04290 [Candidatus Pacearchaeota archaeon]|nr:hypothetical protein [Candidatus Pacearchaeota archaeon]